MKFCIKFIICMFVISVIIGSSVGILWKKINQKQNEQYQSQIQWSGVRIMGKQIGFTQDGYVIWRD